MIANSDTKLFNRIASHIPPRIKFVLEEKYGIQAKILVPDKGTIVALPDRQLGYQPKDGEERAVQLTKLIVVYEGFALVAVKCIPPVSIADLGLAPVERQGSRPKQRETRHSGRFVDLVAERRLAKLKARRKPDGRIAKSATKKLARMGNVLEHQTAEVSAAARGQVRRPLAPLLARGKAVAPKKK